MLDDAAELEGDTGDADWAAAWSLAGSTFNSA